ncbi:hypothetical protein QFW77_00890 [Luteimonas sp. RD2P54]|uniref:DUF4145 domain-containing protein n=1 Tax=Luteimonas endophytica TaxID=3042023 RepID=A0ABT6J3Z7_9GAMM|nr:hypothetical protein [Luteimonas endophytica]MDH5821551.1 hypothetical protein [Luteimonas endophytica]
MPVSDANAFALLRTFGTLEFALKRIPGFTGVGSYRSAKANWRAVDEAVDALPASEFLDRMSAPTRDKLLGGARHRPMVQVVDVIQGQNLTRFDLLPLHASDARAVIEATRRVRNNLFHGGKEDPLEAPYPGDDDEWAVAAREVAELLLDLLDRQMLRP